MASREQGGEQGGVRGNGEESEGALVLPNSHRQEQAAAADEVRRSALAWRTRSGHVFPLKHFVVQVACSEVVKVGR